MPAVRVGRGGRGKNLNNVWNLKKHNYLCTMFFLYPLNNLANKIEGHSYFGNNKRLLQILKKELDWKDKFSEKNPLIHKLNKLVDEIVILLEKPIIELSEEIKSNSKLLNKLKGYEIEKRIEYTLEDVNILSINHFIDLKVIQALKLKMVIKPEFLINTHTHNVTKHQYAILRVLWLDNNLKKIRKYSTSLGNLDTFGSIENINPNIIKEEKKKLELKLQELYAEEYP